MQQPARNADVLEEVVALRVALRPWLEFPEPMTAEGGGDDRRDERAGREPRRDVECQRAAGDNLGGGIQPDQHDVGGQFDGRRRPVGLIALAIGLLWIGQGAGVIAWPKTSFMINEIQWAGYGVALAAVGLILIWQSQR